MSDSTRNLQDKLDQIEQQLQLEQSKPPAGQNQRRISSLEAIRNQLQEKIAAAQS